MHPVFLIMKYIRIRVLLISLLLFSTNVVSQNDLSKQKVSGHVKSIQSLTYKAFKHGDSILRDQLISSYNNSLNIYDENGFLSLVLSYDDSMKVDSKSTFNWNGDSTVLKITVSNIDGTNNVIESLFNKKGIELETNFYDNSNELFMSFQYNFDKMNNNTETIYWDITRGINRDTSIFDGHNNKIESYSIKANGGRSNRKVFQYNVMNQLIQEATFNENGSLESTSQYQYDSSGNKIKEIILDEKFEPLEAYTYTYNYQSDLTEIKNLNPSGKILSYTTFEYIFDKQGNWIKKIEAYQNQPKYITDRKIEYY